jgi:hypothetical protein
MMKLLNSYITHPNNNYLMLTTSSILDSSYTYNFIKHTRKLHCKEQMSCKPSSFHIGHTYINGGTRQIEMKTK